MIPGRHILDEEHVLIEDGEHADAGSWVYVWLAGGRVIYVGATGLPPTVRCWLHLHDESPEVGHVRAQHPEALVGSVVVRAFRLAPDIDRQDVRRALVSRLHDHPVRPAVSVAADSVAAEVVSRLGVRP